VVEKGKTVNSGANPWAQEARMKTEVHNAKAGYANCINQRRGQRSGKKEEMPI